MNELVGEVLDPHAVVGSGAYAPASDKMELGAMAFPGAVFAAPGYAIEEPMVHAGSGASASLLSVPIVLRTQHVTEEYFRRFVLDPARIKRAVAEGLADVLERDTAHFSTMRRAARHPVFAQLVELAPASVAVALHRLAGAHRPLWMFFLQRATGDRPASGADSVEDAANLWRRWGRGQGLI